MPIKPQNSSPRSNKSAENKKIRVERDTKSFWQTTQERSKRAYEMATSTRSRIICGLLLLVVALVLGLSFVSFLISGEADYSLMQMSYDQRVAERLNVHNFMGLPGAWLAQSAMDDLAGFMAFIFVLLPLVYGLRLLHGVERVNWRVPVVGIFALLWGSVALAFAQQVTGIAGFFHWGGKMGTDVARWISSYLYTTGTLIVMLTVLVVFIILVDKHVVEHLKRLFVRTKKEDSAEETTEVPTDTTTEGTPDTTLTFRIESEDKEPTIEGGSDAATPAFEIKIVNEEEEVVGAHKPDEKVAEEEDAQASDAPEVMDDFEAKAGDAVEIDENDPEYILKTQGPYDPRKDLENYQFPSLNLLKVYDNETQPIVNQDEQQANANRIVTTLRNYGVEIESIKATVGPTVTLYEVVPKAGTRVSTIQRLENDIMLALSAEGIRIIAPMPGKGTVGIEVPNEKPQIVSMHSVLASKRFQEETKMRLPVAIGRTITNETFMFDLAKTPHLLVAGATGQGKSVGLNAILSSLLYKKHPAELKFVLVDPKMVEFTIYKPLLRHYMAAMPDQDDDDIIITDCQKVINTLNSLVIEMEDRYSLLAAANCRNLEDYNEKFIQRRLNPVADVENKSSHKILHHHYMPYLVIVIDEYGDFIMQAGKEVETPIARITQKARAVGMHMILATQRPSVNIVTGVIKANIPTRIAFRTQSVIDSRTVLDTPGANQLIGKGDMLYSAGGNMTRIQCAFIDTPEVERVVANVHDQPHYFEPYQLPEYVGEGGEELKPGDVDMKHLDPMFADVARYVVSKQEGSTSRLQRAFEIGYNRAGKLSDQLEAAGIVGPNKGPKGRDVLIQDMDSLENLLSQLGA